MKNMQKSECNDSHIYTGRSPYERDPIVSAKIRS
jgi:hypothetical protein